MINNLLLKISLTDGCTVAQDMLSILCPTATPTATVTNTPTVTPTVTPTPTIGGATDNVFFLNQTNNFTYNINGNIVAKFIATNANITNTVIKVPRINSSSATILTVSTIIYNNAVVGQLQFDSTRLQQGTLIDVSFIASGSLLTYNNVVLSAPRIVLN
jgi:hypothetical protein